MKNKRTLSTLLGFSLVAILIVAIAIIGSNEVNIKTSNKQISVDLSLQ